MSEQRAMPSTTPAEAVRRAVAALARGQLVVVTDDADRENEGDLVGAAELISVGQMAFLVRHSTGIVCTPMSAERADVLGLPLMVAENTDVHYGVHRVCGPHQHGYGGVGR